MVWGRYGKQGQLDEFGLVISFCLISKASHIVPGLTQDMTSAIITPGIANPETLQRPGLWKSPLSFAGMNHH